MQYSLYHLFVAPYPDKKLQKNPQITFPEKSVEGLGLIWGKNTPFWAKRSFFKISIIVTFLYLQYPHHSTKSGCSLHFNHKILAFSVKLVCFSNVFKSKSIYFSSLIAKNPHRFRPSQHNFNLPHKTGFILGRHSDAYLRHCQGLFQPLAACGICTQCPF